MVAETQRRELRRYRSWALASGFADGVRDARFMELIQQLGSSPYHSAPPISLLVDGPQAFEAVLKDLATAQEEILLETYILRDDRIGTQVQSALIAAAKRGVRVAVLADAMGSAATAESFWEMFEVEGVVVRRFHRFWHMPFDALHRDHRKIIVIDRTAAFTGGMNIGEEYGSSIRAHSAGGWRDTFMRIEGSVALELAAVFAEGWDRANGPPLPGLEYVSWSDGIVVPPLRTVQALGAQALRARIKRRVGLHHDRNRGRRVKRVEETPSEKQSDGDRAVLVLDSRPGRGQREIIATVAALVGGARKRLWITTPYFAPPTGALQLLIRSARRGVDVRLLLPGPKTDVPLARHAAHGAYSVLLENGVRLFEYQAATLHSKTVVVDGFASVIGSSNLDFRSLWLNAECNLLLFDDVCAAELEQAFLVDLKGSIEVTTADWSKRTISHRIHDLIARALRAAL